ncbi:MAG: bifunctional (p)ppGpp synthetase/guanosine-3',5'-bis(diphosphate) 3'-pyrophosphohydrolase [Eubacterium sp.]|nr:bifunctional (p)ppGpp synthetase/guanosine-3',5'-bis(diphosphate) 3'-pyrophosphohydrolase [Eubacterium sp.]
MHPVSYDSAGADEQDTSSSSKENDGYFVDRQLSSVEESIIRRKHSTGVVQTKDFEDPDTLYNELIERIHKYHPSEDLSLVEKAYNLASEAHKDQARKSGEPYIIHPLSVAIILADLEMDKETICAGLLHDVVEDTDITDQNLRDGFSDDVALLVDGVTKLGQLSYDADKVEVQGENLRKMFLAMARDIRVIIIKLADRLHNMRTLKYMKPEKQKEKARETMEIYAPIAQRLGISRIKIELDDLSLKYLEPDAYYDLVEKIAMRKSVREEYIGDLVKEVKSYIDAADIKAIIDGRVKHFFSIYKKMKNQNKTLDQIYDLFAIRIIVEDVKDCYAALGVIHERYKPIPGRFKDYIAMPKPNMYQSLHTTLIGNNGQPFEIQIRTYEMHRTAEYGIAAHWKYKEVSNGVTPDMGEAEKLTWLRQILEWQQDMSDNHEYVNLLKSDLDLFSDMVFCFTPSGDVKNLPIGSTPVDFAYSIHSAVGNRMVGAKVNGKLVPIDYELRNGDRVEVITSQNTKGPSRDWLNIVKSAQAKNKINQWFRNEYKEENIAKGKELLVANAKTKGFTFSDLTKTEYEGGVIRKYGFHDWDQVLASVGRGGIKEGQVVNKLIDMYEKDHPKVVTDEEVISAVDKAQEKQHNKPAPRKSRSGIVVRGMDDCAVHFSKCCNPVPGDEIVGFITRGRGVSVHRTDCVNVIHMTEADRTRLIDVEWRAGLVESGTAKYLATINIYANNRTGLLADISKYFNEKDIDIQQLSSKTNKQGVATINMAFSISNKGELREITERIRQVAGVIDIERTSG